MKRTDHYASVREASLGVGVFAVSIVAAGAVLSLLAIFLPSLHFAYRSPPLHATIETASGLIGLSGSVLVHGRFRSNRDAGTLALVVGLALLALTNFLFATVPWVVFGQRWSAGAQWATVFGSVAGAALLAAAAWLGGRSFRRPAAVVALPAAAVAAVILVLGSLLTPEGGAPPLGVDPAAAPFGGTRTWEAPVLAVAQIVTSVFFVAAAVGFLRRATRTRDEFMQWLSASAALAGLARLDYFLFPSLYSQWVYIGDVLRLASYLVLLVGAIREIAWYQEELRELAARRERQRIAHDLHDGLAQELAYIAAYADELRSGDLDRDEMAQLASAAERALSEAREAVAVLRGRGEALQAALQRAVNDVAARYGLRASLEVRCDDTVSADAQAALLRIAREAVSNAGRHGGARSVAVELGSEGHVYLRVRDDGNGFVADGVARRDRFGLRTMSERVEALGGTLEIRSTPSAGTEVEVTLP